MRNLGHICLAFGLAAATAAAADPGQPEQAKVVLTNFESNLPFVFLQTTQRIVSGLRVPCGVRLVLPGHANAGDADSSSAQIGFHGASSQGYPKKSFRLILDVPASWLGMPARRQWVLNAATVDHSLMRHKPARPLGLRTTRAEPVGPPVLGATGGVESVCQWR